MPNPKLLVIPCPIKINCPGTDSPFANLTMEAPDSEIFIGQNFGYVDPPPLGWSYRQTRGFAFCGSVVSQQDANLCAQRGAYDDKVDQPPGDPTPGDWRTPDGQPAVIHESAVQQANANCGDGEIFTFRLPAGAVHNIVQAIADEQALSICQGLAVRNAICIIGDFNTTGIVGQGYNSTVQITGQGPFTFSVIAGQLPPGLTLHNAGTQQGQNAILLGGIPTTGGVYNFTVQVVGAAGDQQKNFTVTVTTVGFQICNWAAVYASLSASGTPTGGAPLNFVQSTFPAWNGVFDQKTTVTGVGDVWYFLSKSITNWPPNPLFVMRVAPDDGFVNYPNGNWQGGIFSKLVWSGTQWLLRLLTIQEPQPAGFGYIIWSGTGPSTDATNPAGIYTRVAGPTGGAATPLTMQVASANAVC